MLNNFYDKFIFTNSLKFKQDNFFLLDIPFLIAPVDLFVSLFEKNSTELNKEIYYAVKVSTRKYLVKRLEKEFPLKGDKLMEFFLNYFIASGWGQIKLIDFDRENNRAILNATNSPIALQLSGKIEQTADHVLRGILAGVFSEAYNMNMDCVETSCQSQTKPHCEFVIKKTSDFDYAHDETKEQLNQVEG
ncbi:MAG: V4R domain-containing protein [Candidatus Diapherotrites archaeon]|nr:V4R domain-containing protein [Candidatus Diapherotrites archaeon]